MKEIKFNDLFIFFMVISSLLFIACSSDPPKPDPGRCFTNIDCPKGQKCKNTRCEDIYHPRHEIKIN